MNQREKWVNRSRNKGFFRLYSPLNTVRINSGNSLVHEVAKAILCYELRCVEHDFITEAEGFYFGTPFRCDVVDLTYGLIFEVVFSEKEESILEKRGRYPLPIQRVNARELLKKYGWIL